MRIYLSYRILILDTDLLKGKVLKDPIQILSAGGEISVIQFPPTCCEIYRFDKIPKTWKSDSIDLVPNTRIAAETRGGVPSYRLRKNNGNPVHSGSKIQAEPQYEN